jgi:hypothetical protein
LDIVGGGGNESPKCLMPNNALSADMPSPVRVNQQGIMAIAHS